MKKPNYTKSQKKSLLIYSGELVLFSIIFLVLGLLILFQVIKVMDWKRYVFTFLTLIGGLWPIADFIWLLSSQKRRAHNSLMDKCLPLPVPLALIPLDIYILATYGVSGIPDAPNDIFRFGISLPLCYLALVYLFEGIYHYFVPLPGLLEDLAEAEKKDAEEEANQKAASEEKENGPYPEEKSPSEDSSNL